MSSASVTRILAVLAALVLLATAAGFGDDDESRDWNTAPASEIHERLAAAKAGDLQRRTALKQLLGGSEATTQTNYDVTFYDVKLRINDTTEIVWGRVTFVATAAEGNVGSVEVDLFLNMTIDSIVGSSGQLAFTRLGNVVTIDLDGTYRVGEQFAFDFWYHGHPTESAGFGAFTFGTYGAYTAISTLSEPYFARTWWPCKDRMDDKADSFNIAIEVDTSLYAASNGTLDSMVAHGGNTHTYYYRVRYPMATYLFMLAISEFQVWYDQWVYNGGADTMPLEYAVYPSWYTASLSSFAVTPGALTIFSDVFGPYPFATEKYGHAHFTWGGAMEHQTMTSLTANSFSMSTTVIVHEMAHQWWGDLITCKSWRDIWLNEGWASYAEALYYEALGGWTAYINHMIGMYFTAGGTVYCQDTSSTDAIFTSRVYDKGAWVLHSLRGVLGDSLFFAGVHAYYNSPYQFKAATTEDFKNVFEAATGVELDWFFNEWVYGTYYPNFWWYWMSEPAAGGGWDVYLRVRQVQTTEPRVFTMPIKFTFTGVSDTVTVWADEKIERTKIHLPANPSALSLDPMNWMIKSQQRLAWDMFVITPSDGLDTVRQYSAYTDTIELRGGSGWQTWSVTAGSLPTGLSLSNEGVISGTTSDTGRFAFTVFVDDNSYSYTDQVDFTLYAAPSAGKPGDVTNDGQVNVADLTLLIDFLFRGGEPPVILNSADVNGSCDISVADVTYLVAHLFRGGPAPLPGCVN
ncbi:MAG TPA: M1 family aminopeptidase [candidate division Zixibacteria bacterium]|nr:putative Ig domain-containing protein [candidate division Zixibacteria bacterium]MDD4918126.1 M1 family aminopeptidase [candidate division Zixibacteria bacterium]MDM7972069.1 M1 family aminopeptidase [candidate division Zixibacteria bacterium]HOD66135.1 M1 family aminopeptidase [candidate division Zixibacteria bacterium]HPM37356.1 M1 family aminopeptidase [candidate division Zixibacteria bacterium]